MFQVPVYFIYLVELDPIYPSINMRLLSQLYTYCGKGFMSCISAGISCRFPGRLISEGWSRWVCEKKMGEFRAWF